MAYGDQVQAPATKDSASTNNDTLAYGSNITAGSLLLLCFRTGQNAPGTITVTDSLGQTWAEAVKLSASGHGTVGIFYKVNSSAGANTVTFQMTGGASTLRWSVHEHEATSGTVVDQIDSGSGDGNPTAGISVVTTAAVELLVSAMGTNGATTLTGPTSFTVRSTVPAAPNSRFGAATRVTATAGTYSGEWQGGGDVGSTPQWVVTYATFKDGTPAGPTVPFVTRLGGHLIRAT